MKRGESLKWLKNSDPSENPQHCPVLSTAQVQRLPSPQQNSPTSMMTSEHSMDRGPTVPVTAQTPWSRTILFPNGTSPMNSTLAFPIVAGYTEMLICSCFFFSFFSLFHPSSSAFKWVAEAGHGKAGSRNIHLCFVPKVPDSIEREAAWAETDQKHDF